MTVDDPVTKSRFLAAAPPTFYHAKIPYQHWQLRSMLCSPSPNILYYPSGDRIYQINTATRKRRLIGTLPFEPRCVGARYGWVCVGGAEHGQFATIRMKDEEAADEDEAMALDMDMDGPDEPRTRPRRSVATVMALGGTIVNSITLHRPPSSTSDDDVLAVLTNNDMTVRIFHLAQNRVITNLLADVSTNHASISPDGQHLVVVGDAPTVYFYHPSSTSGSCPGTPGTGIGESGGGSWVLSSHPPLAAGTNPDTLMSTSFSPSSLHCAIASQGGIITIFDTRYLSTDHEDGPSPLVKVINSSRPFTDTGAVRSVCFSPAPWDLLVWAEHSGRVCVADTRTNFTRRQAIDVLAKRDELIEVELEDIANDASAWDLSESLLDSPSSYRHYSTREEEETEEDSAVADGTSRSAYIDELADLVLENSNEWLASYTSRIRNLTPPATYSSYTAPELLPSSSPSSSSIPLHSLLRSPSMSGSGITGMPPSTPALLRDHRERQLERERARQRIHDPPRRRNSTHPSYTDTAAGAQAHTHTHTQPVSSSATSYPRLARPTTSSSTPLTSRPLEQLAALIAEQRRRSAEHRPQRRGQLNVETASPVSYTSHSHDMVDITGCTLSVDGRKLYVATDGGVVEYAVDVASRKAFPSITPR